MSGALQGLQIEKTRELDIIGRIYYVFLSSKKSQNLDQSYKLNP